MFIDMKNGIFLVLWRRKTSSGIAEGQGTSFWGFGILVTYRLTLIHTLEMYMVGRLFASFRPEDQIYFGCSIPSDDMEGIQVTHTAENNNR